MKRPRKSRMTRSEWAATQYTREQWLTERVADILTMYEAVRYSVNIPIRVSCGWPGIAPGGRVDCVKGVTYMAGQSADGVHEIFVSPMLSDPLEVFGILVHEVAHVLLPDDESHGPGFDRMTRAIGADAGPPEQRLPGPALTSRLMAILDNADAYPHAAMKPPAPMEGSIRIGQDGQVTITPGPVSEKEVSMSAGGERLYRARCQCGFADVVYLTLAAASRTALPYCLGCSSNYRLRED